MNIYLCFIDNEQAFDRVKHEKSIACMDNLDIDGKYLSLIRYMYWNKKRYMINVDGLSPEFHNKAVCYHLVCLICTHTIYLEQLQTKVYTLEKQKYINCTTLMKLFYIFDTSDTPSVFLK